MGEKRKILIWIPLLICIFWVQSAVAQIPDTTKKTIGQSNPISLIRIDDSFLRASALFVTSQPLFYVVETGRHRFLVLNDKGVRLDSLGNQGFGNYQFDQPLDVDATNGLKIYVSDYSNGRIQIFDRRLQYLSSITPPAGSDQFFSYQPTVLAVSDNRELFFYEHDSGRIIQYNENGELLATIRVRTDRRLSPPADIDTFNGQLMLADSTEGVLHFLKPEGQYIKFTGGFKGIRALATSSKGIWVLTSNRVIHLNGKGRFVKQYSWSSDIEPVDLDIYGKFVYLLTRSGLWRGKL